MRTTTIQIVKATAPVLEQLALPLTTRFYELLFELHPELEPMFHRSQRHNAEQAHALADAIIAFARHVDELDAIEDALRRIAHRHASLDVQPHHYDFVGYCLLRAIGEVLGDPATDAILEAWSEAFSDLARHLSKREEAIYRDNEHKPGGWRGARRFEVVRIEQQSATIRSFTLRPVDGGPLMPFAPGQYLTVLLDIDGRSVRRNYSISSPPGRQNYRITIKHHPGGEVSEFFHQRVQEGFELDVLPPCGDLVLDGSDRPLVLVSAGVGVTPTISMLDAAITTGRRIIFLHAARNGSEHAFHDHVVSLARRHPQLSYAFAYEHPEEGDMPHYVGRIDERFLAYHLADVRAEMELFVVGPKGFMETVVGYAQHAGIPDDRVHYEFFGPTQPLITPSSTPRPTSRPTPRSNCSTPRPTPNLGSGRARSRTSEGRAVPRPRPRSRPHSGPHHAAILDAPLLR
ncbi:MAG: NO-inducible flavohemoprotein [Myxococcota bacterium]